MQFVVRWPDDTVTACYSPSLVVRDFLSEGAAYDVPTFVALCREALTIASDRVREKYGFACSLAAAELARIDALAARFVEPTQVVLVEQFRL
jgi:uncharacterized repeat protein (TIGR04042 family)